eukprot:TRINITY_DN19091_c0_g1_i1.p1 TRINITY_DN19091_c0_g1~~TRINITY_DN19091_c0_g1_i1.p1  ORF type:complete len:468 (+),score=91.30 TRINITY_DN19091_c0_g1_i1:171-1574(+)
MLNVAAAFGGGYFIKQTLDNVALPSFQRAKDSSTTFKLSVRVVACAAPALPEPGVWSRQRPRLEVGLGDVQKDTEFADFVGKGASSPSSAGACARECPWRFGDSLTFVAGVQDVLGPGLRLRLRGYSDVSLGPLQLQLTGVSELGEAAVDLRQRVLPACVGRGRGGARSAEGVTSFESPVLLLPLLHTRGGVVSADHDLGKATAHVAMVFSLNVDPETILAEVHAQTRQIGDVLASRAGRVMRWLDAPIEFGSSEGYFPGSGVSDAQSGGYFPSSAISDATEDVARWAAQAAAAVTGQPLTARTEKGGLPERALQHWDKTLTPADAREAERRASARYAIVAEEAIQGPDLDPEGWMSRKGRNGRIHWHHRDLGPAPWEDEAEVGSLPASPRNRSCSAAGLYGNHCGKNIRGAPVGANSAPVARSFGPIASPDLPADGWISHSNKDGRTFWHNTALGPPPWKSDAWIS